MAVTIRLARHGRKKQPFYRVVAADKERAPEGKFLELLGTYNPLVDPIALNLKEDRVKYWIGVGAEVSDTCGQLIEKTYPGYLSGIVKARREKIQATRKKRKARAKA